MKLYNAATDSLIINVKPFFKGGFVSHYVAKDVDTGKTVKIAKDGIKAYQDIRYVDYQTLRGMANETDDFILATMCKR